MIFYKFKFKAILALVAVIFIQSHLEAQGSVENKVNPKDSIENSVNVILGKRSHDRFVGNQNIVSGEDLKNYPALDIKESLAGKLPGLFMLQKNGNIGTDVTVIKPNSDDDNFDIYVRGSYGDYLVLIDGFERPFANLNADEIKSIQVLKDPVSKSMYGGRVSNGVILITTKRGIEGKNVFTANVQRGIKMPSALPKYLNSGDYAEKKNEAIRNDFGANVDVTTEGGYSDQEIALYRDQSRPLQYPNVDFYDEFLNNSMNITRISTEYFGGTDRTKYYFHSGVQNEGGLEKYGTKKTEMNMYHLRANLDAKFNDNILVLADFSGYLGDRQYAKSFSFNTLSKRFPNEYPIFVAPDSLGGNSDYLDNPYGAQTKSGYIKETYALMQSNLGFEFKLDNLVKGLKFKPSLAFDIFHQQNLNSNNTVAIYEISEFDDDGNALVINEIQREKLATSQSIGDDNYSKRWAFNMLTSYSRDFGDHKVDGDLLLLMTKEMRARRLDDYKRQNITGRLNYSFQDKYIFEGSLNYTGSSAFSKENRFKLFPALGASWVVSNEEFLNSNPLITYLKINATWGKMGNGNIGNRLWVDSWNGSSGSYNANGSLVLSGSEFARIANPNIDWPTLREIDVNVEAQLAKKIGLKLSYFDYLSKGLLSRGKNQTLGILGGSRFLPQQNFGETALKGTEAEISYRLKTEDWNFELATHMTLSKSERLVIDELYDPNYTNVGNATDDIRGFNAIGFYSEADITAVVAGDLAIPSGVNPNDIKVGNIKYEDFNGDKVIDKYDTKVIGNSTPRLMYGANMKIAYKNFELFASFLGYGKYQRSLRESDYYHIYGVNRKYSNAVVDGLPNGNAHPLLTTGTPQNDTKQSTYWIVDGSFLKLKNVALSYTLPKNISNTLKLGEVKIYAYGSNLFTVSKIKELDPESFSAGISAFPLFSTYAGGISISF